MESSLKTSPAISLYAHQRAWLADKSRFKVGNMCRQFAGKSFSVALEAVDDIAEQESLGRRTQWVLLSRGERQSKELIEKAKMHTEAYSIAASDIGEEAWTEDASIQMLTIKFPLGSRIIALPANPDTARGFTGNLVLDEFALHKDSRKIWTAAFGTISRGGGKLRVVSTPMGKLNQFYSVWTNPIFSKHFVDVFTAMKNGSPITEAEIEELRLALGDDEAWQQEYLCQFVDEATAFLTFEMIAACEDELAGNPAISFGGPLYVGIDIGRKRDLTVIITIEPVGDVGWVRTMKRMERTPFRVQREEIFSILRNPRVARMEIDASGLGMQLAEEAHDAFGARVEQVTFTQPVKESLAIPVRSDFEDRLLRIPAEVRLRNALHSVKKVVTGGGNIRFDAERTEDGHADEFWALALARDAWKGGAKAVRGLPLIVPRRALARAVA